MSKWSIQQAILTIVGNLPLPQVILGKQLEDNLWKLHRERFTQRQELHGAMAEAIDALINSNSIEVIQRTKSADEEIRLYEHRYGTQPFTVMEGEKRPSINPPYRYNRQPFASGESIATVARKTVASPKAETVFGHIAIKLNELFAGGEPHGLNGEIYELIKTEYKKFLNTAIDQKKARLIWQGYRDSQLSQYAGIDVPALGYFRHGGDELYEIVTPVVPINEGNQSLETQGETGVQKSPRISTAFVEAAHYMNQLFADGGLYTPKQIRVGIIEHYAAMGIEISDKAAQLKWDKYRNNMGQEVDGVQLHNLSLKQVGRDNQYQLSTPQEAQEEKKNAAFVHEVAETTVNHTGASVVVTEHYVHTYLDVTIDGQQLRIDVDRGINLTLGELLNSYQPGILVSGVTLFDVNNQPLEVSLNPDELCRLTTVPGSQYIRLTRMFANITSVKMQLPQDTTSHTKIPEGITTFNVDVEDGRQGFGGMIQTVAGALYLQDVSSITFFRDEDEVATVCPFNSMKVQLHAPKS